MKTLRVVEVNLYSTGDECAAITLRSDRGELVAFCWPCEFSVGDIVPNRLSILDGEVRAAYLSDWSDDAKKSAAVERLERTGTYAYRGCGHVVDRGNGLVEVLGFFIDFGDVPCSGPVEFEIFRLDV